ncbi:MAG: LPXTG cell wall anchor domain-containing protein [Oscillospiraceae bacterium]|nr:LPXTG cell wall anchor domain-containing protein [Oscillospiraceae bacterium]
MKRRMKKKTLALAVVLTMALSMLPALQFTASAYDIGDIVPMKMSNAGFHCTTFGGNPRVWTDGSRTMPAGSDIYSDGTYYFAYVGVGSSGNLIWELVGKYEPTSTVFINGHPDWPVKYVKIICPNTQGKNSCLCHEWYSYSNMSGVISGGLIGEVDGTNIQLNHGEVGGNFGGLNNTVRFQKYVNSVGTAPRANETFGFAVFAEGSKATITSLIPDEIVRESNSTYALKFNMYPNFLPVGRYYVKEIDSGGYNANVTELYFEIKAASGGGLTDAIWVDGPNYFLNTKDDGGAGGGGIGGGDPGDTDFGSLMLTKKVTNTTTSQEFKFTVTFSLGDEADETDLEYIELSIDGGLGVLFENGSTFMLEHDQTAEFLFIPPGATYEITEESVTNYSTSWNNDGAIESGMTVTGTVDETEAINVVCTNSYSAPYVPPSTPPEKPPVEGDDDADDDDDGDGDVLPIENDDDDDGDADDDDDGDGDVIPGEGDDDNDGDGDADDDNDADDDDDDDDDGGRRRPQVVFEDGDGPENYPEIDFGKRQANPDTPGGSDHSAPPVPTIPGNKLTPQYGEDGELIFVEFDEDDVPLGAWGWDDDEWVFDDWAVPLGDFELPQTGIWGAWLWLLPIGLILTGFGAVVLLKRKFALAVKKAKH